MSKIRLTAAALTSVLALGTTAAPAVADDAAGSCDQQQAQVDRAQAKYDALQQKFAEHPTHKGQKAKKAQAQRVARAQARLDKCEAGSTES
ncbi:hypothetical protein [Nocardioides sp. URHA0032]|uniref:hypothetical protein n=1 Tax=Nocardioides sp. URHA0032 TaxID=1380388 RepID=UPI00048D55D4|nr:hypothetical protein [Nocardioides sp. URHA0032]